MNRRIFLLLGAATLTLTACATPLGTFNALAPKDGGARRVLRDQPYGPDPRQRVDVFAPAPRRANAPVVVFIHGGSWASGDKSEYGFVGDALAANGYVAVLAEYRLVPQVAYPAFNDDCAAAVKWAQDNAARFGGDPTRIVLMGHSAGAYIAMMLALDPHYLAVAGVDAHAIRGVVGLSGPYDFYPFDVQSTRDAFGQAPQPELTQPVHYVRADAPPMFLGWGERDTLVGRRNIVNLAAAERAAGGHVETKLYPTLDHPGTLLALSLPFRGRAPLLGDVLRFLRQVTAN